MLKNISLILVLITVLSACKQELVWEEGSFYIFEVSDSTAAIKGNVNILMPFEDIGYCWAVNDTPSLKNFKMPLTLPDNKNFRSYLYNLQENSHYFIRLYLISQGDTMYGKTYTFITPNKPIISVLQFQRKDSLTLPADSASSVKKEKPVVIDDYCLPEVLTGEAGVINHYSVELTGVITSDCGFKIREKGFVWADFMNPLIGNSSTIKLINPDGFNSILSNLQPNSTYHYRAYVINKKGTVYGNNITFTTQGKLAVLKKPVLLELRTKSASLQAEILDLGGHNAISQGIEIYKDLKLENAPEIIKVEGKGLLNSTLNDLKSNQKYLVRFFVVNPIGTAYSDTITFITKPGLPVVSTSDAKNKSAFGFNVQAIVKEDGGLRVFRMGICVSEHNQPTIKDKIAFDTTKQAINGISINDLEPNQKYYYRAFAENKLGLSYGEVREITLMNSDFWREKSPFPGPSRQSAFSFTIGNKAYIGCGSNNESVPYQDFWEYDAESNTWTQKADFAGSARDGAFAFAIKDKAYVGLGYNSLDYNFFMDIYEYNPSTNTWSKKNDFIGAGREGAIGFSIQNKGYIGLGNNIDKFDKIFKSYQDLWEYNPEKDIWLPKSAFKGKGRARAACFVINNKAYMGTGVDALGQNFKDFWEYDAEKNQWTRKVDFIGSARDGAIAFSIGTKGYIGTGNNTKDIYEYDPSANAWIRKIDFFGTPRDNAFSFAINGKGYIGAGYDWACKNDLWEYIPEKK